MKKLASRWQMPWLSDITSIIQGGRNLLRYILTWRCGLVLSLLFQIHTKHLTVTIDAFTIHNRYFDIVLRNIIIELHLIDSSLAACGWEKRRSFLTRRILPWWCNAILGRVISLLVVISSLMRWPHPCCGDLSWCLEIYARIFTHLDGLLLLLLGKEV